MRDVHDDLAQLVDGELAAFEGTVELDVQQVGLAERGQDADRHQATVPHVELVARPHGAEQMVDGHFRVAAGDGVGVDAEPVDLLHLGDAGRRACRPVRSSVAPRRGSWPADALRAGQEKKIRSQRLSVSAATGIGHAEPVAQRPGGVEVLVRHDGLVLKSCNRPGSVSRAQGSAV